MKMSKKCKINNFTALIAYFWEYQEYQNIKRIVIINEFFKIRSFRKLKLEKKLFYIFSYFHNVKLSSIDKSYQSN